MAHDWALQASLTLAHFFYPLQALGALGGEESCQFPHIPGSFTSLGLSLTGAPSHAEPPFPRFPTWRNSKSPSTVGVTNSSALKGQNSDIDERSRTGNCRAHAHSNSSPQRSAQHFHAGEGAHIAESGKLEVWIFMCAI